MQMCKAASLRWMVRSDMDRVIEIERACFDDPWTKEDLAQCNSKPSCVGMVAERDGVIVGFMMIEISRLEIDVINFAVDPAAQRSGIGSEMVAMLKSHLSPDRRKQVSVYVREANLDAQLFFRSQGFRVVEILDDFWDNCDEQAYLFIYKVQA